MTPRTMLVLAAGIAAVAAPTIATATMAYVTSPAKGSMNAWVMVANDDGSNAVKVVTGSSATISPDGSRLAYQVWVPGQDNPTSSVRDLASGATAVLVGVNCQPGFAWSPDSTMIACSSQASNGKGYVTGNGLGLAQVPASLEGVSSIPVANYIEAWGHAVAQGVAFSPDSTQIAFSLLRFGSHAASGTLYVAPVTNAAARTAVLARAAAPVWSTSGIAAMQSTNVRVTLNGTSIPMVHTQIWTISPSLSSKKQLTHYKASGLMSGPAPVAWSPSGNMVFGVLGGEDVANMATFRVSGGAMTTLFSSGTGSIHNPVAVSADGKRLLYTAGSEAGPAALKTTSLTGRGTRTLVSRVYTVSVTSNWNG
ncbi:MAG: hypothetical protein WCK40_06975 [Thermoleophilia bacterium]